MKNLRKNMPELLVLLASLWVLLTKANLVRTYAFLGLKIYLEQLIPSLFPFLVLSNYLSFRNLDTTLSRPFYPLFHKLFGVSAYGAYAIIMGFFCGFPMGAKVISSLYAEEKITKKEAEFLLAFCNNFGPAYFFSFIATSTYDRKYLIYGFMLLFLLPFFYGIALHILSYVKDACSGCSISQKKELSVLPKKETSITFTNPFYALNESIAGAIMQMNQIGAYTILCTVFIPLYKALPFSSNACSYLYALTEISGGLLSIKTVAKSPFALFALTHILLSFNGICAHLQACSFLKQAMLSMKKYMLHKTILCSITILLLLLFSFVTL